MEDKMAAHRSPPGSIPRAPFWKRSGFLFGVLFVVSGFLAIQTACSKTVTHDELWHLPVGLRNLREGRFDVDLLNPPLARMWAAVPLAVAGVTTDHESTGSMAGRRFAEDHPSTFGSDFIAGRIFNLAWWAVCGGLVCLWSWQLWGRDAALLCSLLFATCPNVMAHASLVTPDVALACSFLATLYACWLWSNRQTWGRGALLGILLGISQATKFTGLLLYPIVLTVVCWSIFWGSRHSGEMRTKIGQGLFALLLSLLVLCGTYRFQNVLLPVGQFTFQSEGMRAIQLLSPSPAFPVPFPRDYLLGLDQQRSIMEQLHPVFLDGSWSVTGFPHYYLMTLLWKLPHILQLLLALGLVQGFFFSRFRSTRGTTVFLLISALFVIGVASREGMQLGVRYIMPVLPLFFLLAGPAVGWLQRGGDRWRLMISCLLIGVCDLSLRFHPSHLSYFNEWAGGPIGGRKHLLDSNLDWGQDLHLVKQYMSEQGWKEIGLAYFGTVPPQLFEIKFEIPHSWEPRPGRYAVSVNYVMGRPHVLTLADGSSRGTDIGEFSYFRNLNSVKTLGGSIDIYDVSEDDVAEWKKHFARDARPSN